MKTKFWIVLAAVVTVVACSNKTEKKVDDANDDWRRMQAIDLELRTRGVYLNSPETSAPALDAMDPVALRRTRDLLAEFGSRGNNVLSTSQRKDVKVVSGVDMDRVGRFVASADRLRLRAEEVLGQSGAACADQKWGVSDAIPKRVAQTYLRNLDEDSLARLDDRHPQIERVGDSCRLFRVVFTGRERHCRFSVLVDYNQVVPGHSDREVRCE